MREHETSAPSLGELSEAATPGKLEWERGDCGGDCPQPYSDLYVTEEDDGMREPVVIASVNEMRKFRAIQGEANALYLARLWNDHRAGRLIDPTAMAEAVASARAEWPSWLSPDGGPRDRTPVILAAQARADGRVVVGEGYFDPEDGDGKWWWAGQSSGDYAADAIETYFGTVIGWMPLPAPPTLIPGGSHD